MRSLYNKIKNIVKRGYVSKVLDDSKNFPITNISYLEKESFSEVLSPYGLNVNLPKDTQVLVFSILGVEGNKICIGYSQKDRFKNLKEGEVVVGNPKQQTYIKFNEGGDIEIEVKRDLNIDVKRNAKIIVGKDMDIDVSGGRDVNIDIDRDMNLDVDRNININNTNTVNVNASQTNLGVGGNSIARVGDTVQVNLGTGIGTITSGGVNTST